MATTFFRDFYEHVFGLLSTATELATFGIDPDNIHPSNDVVPAKAGVVVNYAWTEGKNFRKQKRGRGTFAIRVLSPADKVSALDILETIASVMTARRITKAGTKVVVHLFEENDVLDDEVVIDRGLLQAETDFDVRLIKAPSP